MIGRGGWQDDPFDYEIIIGFDDELFASYARFATRLMRLVLTGSREPYEARWALLLRRLSQKRAERSAHAARRDTLRLQRQLDKSMGFAARE